MDVRSILVRAPNWVGDQVLAFPFFFYLRHAYPKAKITVATVSWVKDIQFRGLVDEIVSLPKPLGRGWIEKLRALNEGAKKLKVLGPFDLGITLPNSFSAAWLLYRVGAKRRRGYLTDARGFLLTDKVKWNPDPAIHRAQAYLQLLPTDRVPAPKLEGFWPQEPKDALDDLIPGVLNHFDAPTFWQPKEALEPPEEPYYILAPGSAADSRRWPPEYFVKLAQLIFDQTKLRLVLVGGSTEVPYSMMIQEKAGVPVTDFTAQSKISGLWRLFRNARFTISNDSGLAHIASLCGSKVQVIFGAGNPNRTAPIGPGLAKVTINPVDCWPCELNHCSQPAGEKLKCLIGILPARVWEEAKNALKL